MERLSLWATTTELARLELVLCTRSRPNEKTGHRNKEEPLVTALEKAGA